MNKSKIKTTCFFLFVFIGLLFFYISAHPLYPFDADDWAYVSYRRFAAPILGAWNPGKVLPETVFPLVSSLGVYVIKPFVHDYLNSLMVSYGIFFSLVITVYVWTFCRWCKKKALLSGTLSLALSILFLLFHFLIFCGKLENNYYLFYAGDLNCLFNYTLPAIVNASVVLYLDSGISMNLLELKEEGFRIGLLFLFIYLSLFSNLYHSIILSSYAFLRIVISFFDRKKSGSLKGNMKRFLLDNSLPFIILILWSVCLFYEWQGMRASYADGAIDIPLTLQFFFTADLGWNKIVVFLGFVLFFTAIIMAAGSVKKNSGSNEARKYFISLSPGCFA
ncbi:MAG: hypothetical protein K5989_00700 [Lachnospiraceae bacterium]|nr:hypothetical protein [Lachnospiraceae bacterium]